MVKQLIKGVATFIPGVYKLFALGRTGGSVSARYCYSVWLRHLVMAHESGLSTNPKTIAELGPGDSIGVGLAALLTGSERYYALDMVEFAATERNIAIFDELVDLFSRKEPIPDEKEFPETLPRLKSYKFPGEILTDTRLAAALEPGRIERIRLAISAVGGADNMIQYLVPWPTAKMVDENSIDMILSQAVLEHVEEPEVAYAKMRSWLKSGAFMSHTIDFRCHQTAKAWNGHWTYSDFVWNLIRGKRPFLINRLAHSQHIALMEDAQFEVVGDVQYKRPSQIIPNELAPRFAEMEHDDLVTFGAFVQAVNA